MSARAGNASSPTRELVTTMLQGAAAPTTPVVADESAAPKPEIIAHSDTIVRETRAVPPEGERRANEDEATANRAVAADHDRIAVALNDRVIQLIFSAGLRLHGMYGSATASQLAALDTAVGELDKAIREIGAVLFEARQDEGDRLGKDAEGTL